MKRANYWAHASLLIAVSAFAQCAFAATCSSLASGNWSDPLVWSCGAQPTATDTVIINSPHTVALDVQPADAAALTINAGGIIDATGNNLTVSGNVTINGTYGVAGGGGNLTMTGANAVLSGTGTIDDVTVEIDNTGITIPAGSSLNFATM